MQINEVAYKWARVSWPDGRLPAALSCTTPRR